MVSLIRRVNLVFFRNITYEEQMFIPEILVACKKRRYSLYRVSRTNTIFADREALLNYEAALAMEQDVDALISSGSWTGGRRSKAPLEKEDADAQVMEHYTKIREIYPEAVALRKDYRRGLERFEAGLDFLWSTSRQC